jgi:CBS domain-containing protein
MQDAPVTKIMRSVRVLGPWDIIGRAAEAVRVSGISELPVVSGGRVVGVITEARILNALSNGDPLDSAEQSVESVMSAVTASIDQDATIGQAARMMNELGVQSLPVVSVYGIYLGVVARSDVIGALSLTIRPPSVGGLATPLGVYLTTGNHRAGSSDLGLLLTGVALGALRYAAVGIVAGVLWVIQRFTGWKLLGMMSPYVYGRPVWQDYLGKGLLLLPLVVFGLLLRLSPLSGYHAAEHQTVNAIENGEPLKREYVAEMSRVHPRCGTNILAAVVIFLMVADAFSSDIAILAAMLILIFAWRTIGGYFQGLVTTKRPSRKQLESGIKAGKDLVALYRDNPAQRVNGWLRIWYTGMPQVMAGMMLTMIPESYLSNKLPGLF